MVFAITTLAWTTHSQNLILTNSQGKPIAGFEANAIDPTRAKLTQAYEYLVGVCGQEEKGIYIEQKIGGVSYKDGKLTLSEPDTQVVTGYKSKGKSVTATYKSITQDKDKSGNLVNILTLKSDDGKEFKFQVEPNSRLRHRISDNGEFGSFLMSQGPQDEEQ